MSTAPLRILHIDDNPLDCELIRDAVEHGNGLLNLTTVTSRQEFETQFENNSFDVILTDFNIMGYEGLQVIDTVRQKNPTLPVIVVTGTGSEEVAVEAMKQGAADYVIKTPRHIRRLPMAIEAAIERKCLIEERLKSEQLRRTSEEQLRSFAKALPDLAFIMDENGVYLQLLNAPKDLLYTSVEYRLGKCVCDILPADVADVIMGAIKRTVETATIQTVEYQLQLPNGIRWFEGRTSLMATMSDDKRQVVYVARDITDKKEVELKLRRERNLLRTLIDNVPDYIFVKDRKGRFVASNVAHAKIAGLLPSDVIGKTARDMFPQDIADVFHQDDEDVMDFNTVLVNEERFITEPNGNQQWVLVTKVPIQNENDEISGLVAIARDITARKQTEQALRESEEYLRTVVSSTPVILFVFDRSGILTLLQGQGLNVFNNDPESLIGLSVFETLTQFIPDIHERSTQALNGEQIGSIQTIGDIIFDIRYSPLRNKADEISGIIGIATDITEQIKMERLQIELEKEQEVIALKERFIATASHDFRTPMAVIKMSANILDRYFDKLSSEQQVEKLHQIIVQVDNTMNLLDDVLTMNKANAGKIELRLECIQLKSFCEQIWNDFRHLAKATHSIQFAYNAELESTTLDPNLVQYILVNLLSNAVKYSPINGQVGFEVANNAENIIFRISDNGIGIPEKDQVKLFQPFFRATNTSGFNGTGLGLSIVRSYVETHHGHIEFESKVGEGTTFIVHIPISSP